MSKGSEHAARAVTWGEAMRLTAGDQQLASALARTAELSVLRRLVAAQLPGGEVEYWKLVAEELKR